MKAFKWPFLLFPVILCFACTLPTLQREVKLTINSDPPSAKIFEDGKLLGEAPLNLTYRYEVAYGYVGAYKTYFDSNGSIQALLRPRTFAVEKDGFKPQTRSFLFSSLPHQNSTEATVIKWEGEPEFFTQPNASLFFALEPQDAKPQQQQQQQQQQTTIIMPGTGGAAKTFGSLTILSAPTQAEIYIDGSFVATAPVSSLQIEVGPHKIEIQKNGYKTWTRTMQVLANSPVKIEVELEKI